MFQLDQLPKLNVPHLAWNVADLIDVIPPPGTGAEMSVVLSDGFRRIATSVTVDLATGPGLGGRDNGVESANAWYYFYAVPGAVAGEFDCVGSLQDPSAGPIGYAIWRYLGAAFNKGSAALREFVQLGPATFENREHEDTQSYVYAITAASPGIGAWVSLAGAALTWSTPLAIASAVHLHAFLDGDPGGNHVLWIDGGAPPPYTPTAALASLGGSLITSIAGNRQANASRWVPLRDALLQHYWTTRVGPVDVSVMCGGWRDKYLLSTSHEMPF